MSRLLLSVLALSLFLSAQDGVTLLLQRLTDAPGPSGFEEPVRKIMVAEMQPYAAGIRYDGLGSVIARQGTAGPRIMIDAHMDELGGMIRRIRPDGFLSMQMLGGWLDQALPDQRWVIIGSKGPVPAVTTIWDAHITPAEERARVIPREAIFLDAGARTAAEARALGIEPGDPVAPVSPFEIMAGGRRYVAKAWDDRVGCAVMIEMMRRLAAAGSHPNQLFYAATVQEEIGLRGAQTASEVIRPDLGLALEVGIAKDVPGTDPERAQEVLGGGPGLFLYDTSELPNRKLAAFVRQVAAESHIPLQTDLVAGYGDDSAEIQKSNGGVPTVNLVIPTRYTHAHNGMISRADFDRMVDLMVALVERLDAPTVARIRSFAP
ncbi:MAG TPA: M42 family metallopeptidase [Terriglobales bacterium]|nr:M42 family metallopeptidase [Terriglobales bacterium]